MSRTCGEFGGVNRFGSPCKFPASFSEEARGLCWRHEHDPLQEAKRSKQSRGGKRILRIVKQGEMMANLEDTLLAEGISMEEFVERLGMDELIAGKIRNSAGRLSTRQPAWVPGEFHRACVRELLKRGEEIFRGAFVDAVRAFAEIASDKSMEPKDRLRAAQFVVERVAGKVVDKVEFSAPRPWENLLAEIVAENEELAAIQKARSEAHGG